MTHASDTIEREPPSIQKLRMEAVRRRLKVQQKFYLTPNMIRIVLTGEELEGFWSPGADDNIKIFVPDASGQTVMRSYTPRSYDPIAGELVVDFAVHEAGPATRWALDVAVGDEAVIGGPRGSKLVEGKINRWLLIADETALPAMARRVENGQPGEEFYCIASVPRAADEQVMESLATVRTWWIHREPADLESDDATPLLDRLARYDIPPGTFVWIAAEGSVVKRVRQYLIRYRGIDPAWIKATGYWVRGHADTTAKFEE